MWDRVRTGWRVDRVRRMGYVVLALQLVGFLVWNQVRADRFALTWDFSIYYQAWWLIGHGHLDPFDTLNRFPFWANHGEFLLWPLSVLGDVWNSPAALIDLQAVGLVGAEAVAFGWLCDIARSVGTPTSSAIGGLKSGNVERLSTVLTVAGLVLLVANPWIYWAESFDFHLEVVGVAFVVLTGRQLHRDPARRRVWVWVALSLASGDVVATYLVGVGLGAALAGRRWRRTGLAVAAIAIAWTVVLTVLHANRGSSVIANYGYLAVGATTAGTGQLALTQLVEGVARHPQDALRVLWHRRLDIYGSVASCGLVGIVSPWVAAAALIVLAENALNRGFGFGVPGAQSTIVYVLLPVGTVQVLAMLGRRRRRPAMVLAAVVAIVSVGWGAVWLPRTAGQWVRVSPGAASVLASVRRQVPTDDEVIVSPGIAGPFAGRRFVYPMFGTGRYRVQTTPTWFVIAPSQGIELASVDVADALVAELAGPLHARLVAHGSGIWAFRWVPPPGTHHLVVPAHPPTLGAWSSTGAAGRVMLGGPEADWRAVATGPAGYVVSHDYWTEPPGHYRATVTLSTTVPVNVEVWNATGGVLLARRSIPASSGMEAVTLPVDATHRYVGRAYAGAGPFVISPQEPTPDNRLEIRVWTPGSGVVSVASLELVHAGR